MIMPQGCPHCRSSFLVWDRRDEEPYCFSCGWRKAVRITPEQAKYRVTNKRMWLNLFTSADTYQGLNNFI